MRLQLRDCFENHIEAGEEHCDQLQVLVDSDAFYEIEPSNSLPRYVQVKFSFTSQTCDAFPVFLKYNGNVVASLQLLVLTADKLEVVNNYVTRFGSSFFSLLRYESFTLILYKELSSSIFQSCQSVRHA